jgi:flavin reductase (DIM6/NTAB) family NADH-FMN oxidoreductase RutF
MSSVRVGELEDGPKAVTAEAFRSVFRDHAARVVVVTAAGDQAPAGFTATSLSSVSLHPPMVSFAVARSASAWRTMSRSRRLAVHLLGEDQDWLARTFATSGIDRFAGLRWHPAPGGEPLIDGCAAYLCCQVVQHVPAGDHVLVLARVADAWVNRTGFPLIYHDGGYASVRPVVVDVATPIARSSI